MPSLRLRLASAWLPGWELKGELDRVSSMTTDALTSLLKDRAPASSLAVYPPVIPLRGSLDERRAIMATNHTMLVEALVEAIGESKAFDLGRQALFEVGLKIGAESRVRLGVGDGIDDLLRAAKALYRVLGISFFVVQHGSDYEMRVLRCALAKFYSERTCRVLSASDEGVIRGLNSRVGMRFEHTITSGYPSCMARIWIESGGSPA